jgi:hypothetical protein
MVQRHLHHIPLRQQINMVFLKLEMLNPKSELSQLLLGQARRIFQINSSKSSIKFKTYAS